MKCKIIIEEYLNLNDPRYVPLKIRAHALFCSGCRNEIISLKKIFSTARHITPFDLPWDMSGTIMNRILGTQTLYEKNVSYSKWLSAGSIIFFSILLISYSESLAWLRVHFGSDLEIPLNIVLGLIISLYGALFIGTHLNEIKKMINYINK